MKQFLKLFELLTNLASPLLQFDLDEQNEANQRHHHEEGQKDAHVKILCGLLWKKGKQQKHMCLVKRVISSYKYLHLKRKKIPFAGIYSFCYSLSRPEHAKL